MTLSISWEGGRGRSTNNTHQGLLMKPRPQTLHLFCRKPPSTPFQTHLEVSETRKGLSTNDPVKTTSPTTNSAHVSTYIWIKHLLSSKSISRCWIVMSNSGSLPSTFGTKMSRKTSPSEKYVEEHLPQLGKNSLLSNLDLSCFYSSYYMWKTLSCCYIWTGFMKILVEVIVHPRFEVDESIL